MGFLIGFGAISLFFKGLVPFESGFPFFLATVAVAVFAYLCGSINSAVLVSRVLFRKDVREYGSHNAGLTNMLRVFGKTGAVFTLIGDMAKALVAVLCGMLLCGYTYGGFIAMFFCVIGHAYPVFFGFRGGKGVLSSATAILCLSPAAFLAVIGLFLLMVATTRIVSVGSITAAFFFPLFLRAFVPPFISMNICALSFSLLTTVMVIFLHRANVSRLIRGEEKKLGEKEPPKEEA